jgi:hypothetical protein
MLYSMRCKRVDIYIAGILAVAGVPDHRFIEQAPIHNLVNTTRRETGPVTI